MSTFYIGSDLCQGPAREHFPSGSEAPLLAAVRGREAHDPPGVELALVSRLTVGQGIAPLDGTPTVEELIDCYERLSGRTVQQFLYNEVLATFWRGLAQIRIMKDRRAEGMNIPA